MLPPSISDSNLQPVLRDLVDAVRTSSDPSAYEYFKDFISLITAVASVWIAIQVSRYQREQDERARQESTKQQQAASAETLRQQAEATRLEWVRLFIIEPRRQDILDFFESLRSSIDQQASHTPLLPLERINITKDLSSQFNNFDRQFLTYTDSIGGSNVPRTLRTLIESLRDDLVNMIDQFDDSRSDMSHRGLVTRVTLGRNTFLGALFSLSFQ